MSPRGEIALRTTSRPGSTASSTAASKADPVTYSTPSTGASGAVRLTAVTW
jgi:hypothetical protein